jgi:hypothetical protein
MIAYYQYKADNYCETCVVKEVCKDMGIEGHGLSFITEEALDRLATTQGIDRYDEHTFDSDHFPKVVFQWQTGESDYEVTCCRCGENLE